MGKVIRQRECHVISATETDIVKTENSHDNQGDCRARRREYGKAELSRAGQKAGKEFMK